MNRNEVLCPVCLEKIELDPSNEEYENEPTIYCELCDKDFDGIADAQQDFWYEMNEQVFARYFLKARGYKGKPESWYAVGLYIERFIDKNREKPDSWKNKNSFEQAYDIVQKYFDVEATKPLNQDSEGE